MIEKLSLTFEQWLKRQKERDDPIGDLANDFINSEHKGKFTREHLISLQVRDVILETYDEALRQYDWITRKN